MSPIISPKRCKVCGIEYPSTTEFFYANKTYACGLESKCKKCHYAASRKWVENNPERNDSYKQAYVNRNPEKVADSKKRWQRDNANQLATKTIQYRAAFPERRAAHVAIQEAVRKGELPRIKTQICKTCGNPARHYHHWNYAQEYRLDVIPLCSKCHRKTHGS